MVVIVWYLDLPLRVQSVPITTNIVSSNLVYGEVYSIHHYVSVTCDRSVVFSGSSEVNILMNNPNIYNAEGDNWLPPGLQPSEMC